MEQNTEIVTRDSKAERSRLEAYVKGVAEITSYLSDKYEFADVSITEVVKNNGTVLDSLNIRCDEDNISPNIYLNEFYEKYQAEKFWNREQLSQVIGKVDAASLSTALKQLAALI